MRVTRQGWRSGDEMNEKERRGRGCVCVCEEKGMMDKYNEHETHLAVSHSSQFYRVSRCSLVNGRIETVKFAKNRASDANEQFITLNPHRSNGDKDIQPNTNAKVNHPHRHQKCSVEQRHTQMNNWATPYKGDGDLSLYLSLCLKVDGKEKKLKPCKWMGMRKIEKSTKNEKKYYHLQLNLACNYWTPRKLLTKCTA